MFENNTTDSDFPKTLEIRNTADGMIWQIYHVNNLKEAEILSEGAARNAFHSRTLVDYSVGEDETFPGWRENCSDALKAVMTDI